MQQLYFSRTPMAATFAFSFCSPVLNKLFLSAYQGTVVFLYNFLQCIWKTTLYCCIFQIYVPVQMLKYAFKKILRTVIIITNHIFFLLYSLYKTLFLYREGALHNILWNYHGVSCYSLKARDQTCFSKHIVYKVH